MDRKQAMTLLKQLSASGLIDPSWISLDKTRDDIYKLKLKTAQRTHALEQFFSSNNLVIEEQNGYWLISKP